LLHYLTRLIILIAFLIPVGFVSAFLATMVHEVLGHGLSAILMGGTFDGLEIHWTGQGLAHVSYPGEPYAAALVYLAGIFANILVGLVLLRLAVYREVPYFPRLILLLFAADSVLGASVYMFWNALFRRPDYDITLLLELTDSAALRVFLMGVGIILLIGGIVLVNYVLYRAFGEWLNADGDKHQEDDPYRPVLPLVVLFLADLSRWMTNALLLDIGWWTVLVMTGFTMVILVGIYYVGPRFPKARLRRRTALVPTVLAFVVALIVLLAVLFLL